jgi:hypothetical protein
VGYSNICVFWTFGAYCDTKHYFTTTNIRERQAQQRFIIERFDLKKLNSWKVKNGNSLESLNDDVDKSSLGSSQRENTHFKRSRLLRNEAEWPEAMV